MIEKVKTGAKCLLCKETLVLYWDTGTDAGVLTCSNRCVDLRCNLAQWAILPDKDRETILSGLLEMRNRTLLKLVGIWEKAAMNGREKSFSNPIGSFSAAASCGMDSAVK